MVAAGEASVAVPTFERFRPGVLAVMARQFVRTRKSPLATHPAALVWLLSRVRPLMSLEMRALGVDFLASWKLAFVYPALRVGRTVLVAPRVVPVGHGGCGRGRTRVCVLRAGDRGEAVRRNGDQSCDTLRVAGSNPDDSAPATRAMKVEVVHVGHRTPARRVTGVGMTLTRPRTRRWRQDLTFAFAPAVFLLLDLLVFFILLEVFAGLLLENERRARKGR